MKPIFLHQPAIYKDHHDSSIWFRWSCAWGSVLMTRYTHGVNMCCVTYAAAMVDPRLIKGLVGLWTACELDAILQLASKSWVCYLFWWLITYIVMLSFRCCRLEVVSKIWTRGRGHFGTQERQVTYGCNVLLRSKGQGSIRYKIIFRQDPVSWKLKLDFWGARKRG